MKEIILESDKWEEEFNNFLTSQFTEADKLFHVDLITNETRLTFNGERIKSYVDYILEQQKKEYNKIINKIQLNHVKETDKLMQSCNRNADLLETVKQDLINQLIKEAPEEIVLMCFCGELKDKYNCDGYCGCGAFMKNRRGYSGEEQSKMEGFNEANKQWRELLNKLK